MATVRDLDIVTEELDAPIEEMAAAFGVDAEMTDESGPNRYPLYTFKGDEGPLRTFLGTIGYREGFEVEP